MRTQTHAAVTPPGTLVVNRCDGQNRRETYNPQVHLFLPYIPPPSKQITATDRRYRSASEQGAIKRQALGVKVSLPSLLAPENGSDQHNST